MNEYKKKLEELENPMQKLENIEDEKRNQIIGKRLADVIKYFNFIYSKKNNINEYDVIIDKLGEISNKIMNITN